MKKMTNNLKSLLKFKRDPATLVTVGPRDSTERSPDISPSPHEGVDSGGSEDNLEIMHRFMDKYLVRVRDPRTGKLKSLDNASEDGLGVRIRGLKHILGLRSINVCMAIDVSPSAYSNYECGRSRPGPDVGIRMAALFRVTLDFLYLGRTSGVTQRMRKCIDDYAEENSEFKSHIRK